MGSTRGTFSILGTPPGVDLKRAPPTREEMDQVLRKQMECFDLLHQVNFYVMLLHEALVSKGVITTQEVQETRARIVKDTDAVEAKVQELRAAKVHQKEKVFQAIPYRIRPEELRIPTPEFLRHLREYIRMKSDSLSTAALVDIITFYGLPKTAYEEQIGRGRKSG